MHNLTFLEPRRGLENRLCKAWKEFFEISKFIVNNAENIGLRLDNALKYIRIDDPRSAFWDEDYPEKVEVYNPETGQPDFEIPICKEGWLWLWFITYTAVLVKLDGLYLTGMVVERKSKKGGKKRYFYLKWFGVIYGENNRTEEYEVRRLDREETEKRTWKFDRKNVSLGYLPVQLPEYVAKKVKTGKSLEWYLDRHLNDDKLKKARLIKELFHLFKARWKEIEVLEHLYPLLRTRYKKLPYPRWLEDEVHSHLAVNIVSLKRLLYPEKEEKYGKWFEFWERFC
jgi:hypothetical protein